MMSSLHGRLLLAASLVLAAFLGLTGLALDKAFRDSAEAAVRDRLQGHLYALLAAADLKPDGTIVLPDTLPEARFSTPGSGLYAEISGNQSDHHWRSPSMLGVTIPFHQRQPPGKTHFERIAVNGVPLYALGYGVAWEVDDKPVDLTFNVAQSLEGYYAQVQSFRRSLWGWLGGAALVLLAAQGSILRWSLAPLRRAASDLAEIEAGRQAELEGHYPRELQGLTDNLNALLRNERAQMERYRHTLADLAHSLKTPLAVLRGAVDNRVPGDELRTAVQEQVGRMTQIVEYQLQRASASGRTALMAPVPVEQAAQRIVATVGKVYAGKSVACHMRIESSVVFYGDEGDLLEILGNLIENAYKWCRHAVEIGAAPTASSGRQTGLCLWVQDDGPGIPLDMVQHVLQRGVRADPGTDGHGIGLAVVQEIIKAYHGTLEIDSGPLGGARLTVRLPVRL